MTREHRHSEKFMVSSETMFAHLLTPSSIRKWWGAASAIVLPQNGGVWVAAWGKNEDAPDYVTAFTIEVYEPPRRLLLTDAKYTAHGEKLPFEANMTTELVVEEAEIGCSLTVVQGGFPVEKSADEYFVACEKGWVDTFKGMRRFVEGKTAS